MSKRITIKELAASLGVSPATVSLVLSGKADTYRIAPETRRKIKDAAAQRGYRPDHLAQSMRRGRTDTIGVVFPDVSERYMNMILHGIEQVALNKGMGLMIATSSLDPTVEARNIRMLLDRRVDGLLIVPYAPFQGEEYDMTAIREAMDSDIPVVSIDRHLPGITSFAVIGADRAAAKEATELLISKGCRRLAYIGFDLVITTLEDRRRGFHDAVNNAGIDQDATEILLGELKSGSRDLSERLDALAKQGLMPDGILVSTAGLALQLRHLIETNMIDTQGQKPLIARFGEDSPFFPTGMIQVRQPHEELGRRAAEKLLAAIDGIVQDGRENIEILSMEIFDETKHH